jgi:transcription antitermination factor NusG
VRVTEGPLKNSEGIILRDQRKTALAINMTILGLSAVVTIDANICEKID